MINILHISDIHYGWKKPEEDGQVFNAFFSDLHNTLSDKVGDNYCVISGDLVYKGASDHDYSEFYEGFVKRLTKFVPLNHIMVTPGNHDLNQGFVTRHLEKHQMDIHKKRTEVEFNEYVGDEEKCLLREKFAPFKNFANHF